MIKFNPDERYTIDDVLNHPYFWDDGKKLAFIQEVSDFVESTGRVDLEFEFNTFSL